MESYILHNMAQCKKCGDVIESTYRHDYVECKCGAIAVDGGRDYLRRIGNLEDVLELSINSNQKIFITSDTHFNHTNIIKYCNRPFNSIEEMNSALINNWNNIVSKDDVVFHLGDFFLGSKDDLSDIVSKLKGRIYLIRGNHDRLTVKSYEECGIRVLKNAPIVLESYKIILSHRPLPDTMFKYDYINVHGHIHQKKLKDEYDNNLFDVNKHINVSVDVTDYKPILLKKVLK